MHSNVSSRRQSRIARRFTTRSLAAVACVTAAAANPAMAQSTWTANFNGGFWSAPTNWDTNPVIPGIGGAIGGDAILGNVITNDVNVQLDVNVDLNSLTLQDGESYTLIDSGGVLTLSGAATIFVNNGTHTIAAPIAGTSGVVVDGGNTLTLSATNTYTGTTAIRNGSILIVDSDDQLGDAANAIEFGTADPTSGTLRIDGTAFNTLSRDLTLTGNGLITVFDETHTVSLTGNIGGTGDLIKAGTGTLDLATANTNFDNAISVNSGTLIVNANDDLGSTVGTTRVVNPTGVIALDGSEGDLTIAENFDRFIGRFNGQAHLRNDAGNNTLTGTIDIGGNEFANGILENAADGTTLTIADQVFDETDESVNVVFQGTGNFDITGRITGDDVDVHVRLDDPTDTVTISTAANTLDTSNATGSYWGGSAVVESGTLVIMSDGSNNGELASDIIDVRAGATLDVSDFSSYSLQVVDDPDLIPFNGDETGQTVTSGGTIVGNLNAFEDAIIEPGDSVGTLNITGNFSANQTQANPNGLYEFELGGTTTPGSGVNDLIDISGGANLSASGGGAFAVNIVPANGALDSTGAYTLISANNIIGSATASDFNVAIVDAAGNALTTRQDDTINVAVNASTVTVGFSVNETAAWTGATDGTWDVATTANWSTSDNLFFDLDDVTFADGTGQTSVNVASTVTPGSITFNNAVDTYTFTGAGIAGGGDVTLNAGANVVLANDGNALGPVSIAAGASLTLGDGTTTALDTVDDDATFAIAAGGALVHNNVAGETINGVISGAGNVVNTSGTLTLGGNNTYTGDTTVNGGVVLLTNLDTATPLGSTAAGTTVNGGTLRANGQAATLSENVTLNGGEFAVGGADPAAIVYDGNFTVAVSGGTLRTDGDTGDDALTISNPITGTGPLTLQVGNNSTMTVANVATTGDLTKAGTGTLALTGSVAASNITVEAGTVDVTAGSGSLDLDSQNLQAAGTIVGNITTANSSTIQVGGVAAGLQARTDGLQLDFDAAQDTPGDAVWNDVEANAGNTNINFPASATPVAASDPGFGSLSAAYDISSSGKAISPGSQNAYFDGRALFDGSFEFLINITDTNAGNDQVLLDIGGGRGATLELDGDTLTWGVNGDGDTFGIDSAALGTGWHHVVATVDIVGNNDNAANDSMSLFVDGVEAGTLENLLIDDWSGSNGWSIGGGNSATLDPDATVGTYTPIDFHGEIALARFYGPTAFTLADAQQNFTSLQADPFVDVETLAVQGDLTLDDTAALAMDLHSAAVGADSVSVTGNAALEGELDLNTVSTTDLTLGDEFTLLDASAVSGTFDTVDGVNLGTIDGFSASAAITYTATSVDLVVALSADANLDGIIDTSDLAILASNFGESDNAWATADFNGDGNVDTSDLAILASNFGVDSNPVAALGTAAVPEPGTLALLAIGGLAVATRRRQTAA
ncbi:MAG: autotransporter-associated beta strand repeat-containing protein [Planctomycetota bacterium]